MPAPVKIVLCHLDGLTGLPALNLVFSELGDRVGLVISSKRFGSRHGSFWRQAIANIRRNGVRLTLWMGFDLIAVTVVAHLARLITLATGRPPALATLADLAVRHGAQFIKTTNVNDAATRAAVSAYAPDFIIVMNFDQILQPPLIALPRLATINIHPSLLPALRGPCPVLWAVGERRSRSGVTIHIIEDQTIDAGPVLAQVEVPIGAYRSVAEVNSALFVAGAHALRPTMEQFATDRAMACKQNLAEGHYAGFPTRTEMAAFRRTGLRLCRIGHAARLLAAALGLAGWKHG
jgi:folate-dependent phosphoribosylglycinamide formyltransferase PurN